MGRVLLRLFVSPICWVLAEEASCAAREVGVREAERKARPAPEGSGSELYAH